MRRALACLPLALLFIANVVPTKAQKTAAAEKAEVVVVVREGDPLELACALRVEQQAEWRREGSNKLPEDLKVAQESAGAAGGLTARLHAKAARQELAGVYSCARGPQAQRLRVVVERRAAPTLAAADAVSTTVAPASTTPRPPPRDRVEVVDGQSSAPGAIQYYDILRNVSFTCKIPNAGSVPYSWQKNGTDISQVPEMKDRYKLDENNARLSIQRTSEDDYGLYSCKLGDTSLYWQLHARPYTKLPSADTSVVEGQKLKLVCRVVGRPSVPVQWYYSAGVLAVDEKPEKKLPPLGNLVEASDRIKLDKSEAGVENAQLIIEAAVGADAGAYTCVADASAEAESPHAHAVTVLRVKDMYAALWPFLGICAEVLVLCAIILVYEKRRTKPELDDSDTDNHDQEPRDRGPDVVRIPVKSKSDVKQDNSVIKQDKNDNKQEKSDIKKDKSDIKPDIKE